MAWTIHFYTDEQGRAPVEDFFDALPVKDLAKIQRTLELLAEFGLRLGRPHVRHVDDKIWELRIRAGGKAYRILYFAYTGRRCVLLHAFSKKTQKTPKGELNVARQRLTRFLERKGES